MVFLNLWQINEAFQIFIGEIKIAHFRKNLTCCKVRGKVENEDLKERLAKIAEKIQLDI